MPQLKLKKGGFANHTKACDFHLENIKVRKMATVSLKRGGGERVGEEGGMKVSHTAAPSKVNGLVSHGSDTDLPESTLKNKVSPR